MVVISSGRSVEVLQGAAEHVFLLLLLPSQSTQPVIVGDALQDCYAIGEEDVFAEFMRIL